MSSIKNMPLENEKNVPLFFLGDVSLYFLKYGLVILKNPLPFLMHLYGRFWFHVWLLCPVYQYLEIQFKSNLPRGFDPEFWLNSTHTCINYLEVLYCKHTMVCFESTKLFFTGQLETKNMWSQKSKTPFDGFFCNS